MFRVERLQGILAPVVTPFAADGEIDCGAFADNIRAHLAAGASGIVVTGSTGEAALLDESERAQLVSAARAAVTDDRPVIAGIGGESTRQTIRRARGMASLGADALLVVAPHYYGAAVPDAALREHYERVADASPIPVLLYTIPKYMHFAIPSETVAALAQHPNIVGMKDSAGDATLFGRYLESRSDTFRVLTGSGTLFGEALGMGADGAILAVSLFAPTESHAVLRGHLAGDTNAPRAAQSVLSPLAARIVGQLGVAGVKCAMDVVGLAGGPPRPPLRALDSAAQAEVRTMLASPESAPAFAASA